MRTTVVCGLLGSGKTTFIKNSLRGSGEKTVVLVNDFGAAGIDGEIFSAGGIESVELPSGCVCCTLKPDLVETIRKVMVQFSPKHLVIEPSGVASASGVIEALEIAGVTAYSVVGVVDATEFVELYQSGMYGSFLEDQVRQSDLVLVNKVDRAEKEKIDQAVSLLKSINPRAVLFQTIHATLFENGFIPLRNGDRDGVRGSSQPLPSSLRTEERGKAHFRFETLSFNLDGQTALTTFETFFKAVSMGRFGKVARAKALVNTNEGPFRFDGVFGKVDTVRFEREITASRLVVIGEGLDEKAIEEGLRSITSTY